ncbi:MAG: D-alanyl-D-alanine carboxypeptidase, partial [Paracoccaceae bacterium]|nr:D-alanyl-D-alanine carboxypeptidase [Paracoccaceae bacterium]
MTDVTRRWMVGALMGGGVVAAAGRAAAVADLRPHARPATGVRPELRQSASNAHPDRHAHARSAEDLIAEAKLGGQVAFLVADARTGQVLEGHNVDLAMPPASVAKTLTTAYALETLGKDYRFKTQVVITGPVANGRVQGDLILWGGGDPTLSSDGLAALASQVAKAGIKGITGRFLVADGALPHVAIIDPTQPPEANYNPGISGLNLDFNRVYF